MRPADAGAELDGEPAFASWIADRIAEIVWWIADRCSPEGRRAYAWRWRGGSPEIEDIDDDPGAPYARCGAPRGSRAAVSGGLSPDCLTRGASGRPRRRLERAGRARGPRRARPVLGE